jgi:AcrR family transcriptional regulator
MPKTWDDTLEGHREAVRRSVMEAALALASEVGFQKVSMSQVAARAGITRTTLYKYFQDVDSILDEWHRRILDAHLAELSRIADGEGAWMSRLTSVLEHYALSAFHHHGTRFAEALHQRGHAREAEVRLSALIERIVADGAKAEAFRKDVPANELALLLQTSLSAAHKWPSHEAVQRLTSLMIEIVRKAP